MSDARAFLPKPSFPVDPSSGRNSGIYDQSSPATSGFLLSKREAVSQDADTPVRPESKRRTILALIVIAILVVVIVAIIVPVYFTVIKPKSAATTTGASHTTKGAQPSGSPGSPGTRSAVSGGDGSTVTATNGSTFKYNNKLGGICKFDFSRHKTSLHPDHPAKGTSTQTIHTITMPTRIHGHHPSTKAGITILTVSLGTLLMQILEFVTERWTSPASILVVGLSSNLSFLQLSTRDIPLQMMNGRSASPWLPILLTVD